MHASFIPYGKRDCVEILLRDMEAQKHLLPMTKNGKEKSVWIDGVIRVLPFGVHEYIFPKENKDIVLATLGFNQKTPYRMGKVITILRKLLRYKKPKFNDDKTYLWSMRHTSILPIGIREDAEITGDFGQDKGWTHEAL